MLIERKDTLRIAALTQEEEKEEPSVSSITVPSMIQHRETGTSQCVPPAVVGAPSPRSAPLESLCALKAAPVSLPPPPAWDSSGINWARKTSSSGGTKSRHRSRTFTDFTCSSSSCSSDDIDSSQSSVDLLEDVSKELLVPSTPPPVVATVVALPDLPQASRQQSNNINNNSIINPYQQRPRRPEAQHAFNTNNAPPAAADRNHENGAAAAVFGYHSGGESSSAVSSGSSSSQPPPPPPRSSTASRSSIMSARSRRSLFFLFLIAVYTTFGLTVHNLPVAPTLEFSGLLDAPTASSSTGVAVDDVSADVLPAEPKVAGSGSQDPAAPRIRRVATTHSSGGATTGGGNHLSFARRAAKHTAPKEYRRQRHREFKDFYQQQALRDTQRDYSWYINCGVLVAVALWAWRERRTVLELSSQRGGGEEPLLAR